MIVCTSTEVDAYRNTGITHMIRISNPNDPKPPPVWFKGDYLELLFGDVFSEADAVACHTRTAGLNDIAKAIFFARQAESLLITCDYGGSRSPAIAAVILADQMGAGREKDAIATVMKIRPEAVPNEWVVLQSDRYLDRNGSLLRALRESYDFE